MLVSQCVAVAPPRYADSVIYEGEVRGMFIHNNSYYSIDMDTAIQTSADYGINLIVVEVYPDQVLKGTTMLAKAVPAAHQRGLEIHALLTVMMSAYYSLDGVDRRAETSSGATNWLCPTKETSRAFLKQVVEKLVSEYDIDGFMFDYMRYSTGDMCLGEEDRQRFIADTGITDVNWPVDVLDGGRYRNDFFEWRMTPITELVELMRGWILAIKPDLKFSLAAWAPFQDCPNYWTQWIGQDTANWIGKGWLDFVSPMAYTTRITGDDSIEDLTMSSMKYFTGGREGKIPIIMFLTTGIYSAVDPANFKQQVDMVRNLGADGWIIWRYGGLGDGSGSPDIRDYLSLIDMPTPVKISNVQVHVDNNYLATITWSTNVPTTSKIEYNTEPLFTATEYPYWKNPQYWPISYWDIDRQGNIEINDPTLTTEHSVVIEDLTPQEEYNFKIQSTSSPDWNTAATPTLSFQAVPGAEDENASNTSTIFAVSIIVLVVTAFFLRRKMA